MYNAIVQNILLPDNIQTMTQNEQEFYETLDGYVEQVIENSKKRIEKLSDLPVLRLELGDIQNIAEEIDLSYFYEPVAKREIFI